MLRNTLRIPRIMIFMILIFVSASFTTLGETNNSTVLEHSKNISDNVITTKFVTTSVHKKKNMENSSETTENSSNKTSSEKKKKKRINGDCHLVEETKDMLNCFFITDILNEERTQSKKNEQKMSKFNDTYPPKIFPQDKNVKSIDDADEATRRRLNHTFYTIITPKEIADTFPMEVNKDNKKDTSLADNTNFGNNSEITSQESKPHEGMSNGMIALTTILTILIATMIVYVSAIMCKRYLQYIQDRHRQELFDNDMELHEQHINLNYNNIRAQRN